jgi:CheY-like chemotaxis protein
MAERPNKVLLVDDEPDIREIATMALETVGGLAVEACSGGRRAIERIDAFAPDVVVLDVMMPELDGPAVLRELRGTAAGRDVPVIFLTAKVRPDEVLRLKGEGAIDVLAKPFDPMTLADEVTACYRTAMAARTVSSADRINDKLAQLRERFRRRLADEREALSACVRALDAGEEGTREALRQRAHRIAGTASTVGFEALGAAAARLETALDVGAHEAAGPASDGLMAEVDRVIAAP